MLHFSDEDTNGMLRVENEALIKRSVEQKDELWQMDFDGPHLRKEQELTLF